MGTHRPQKLHLFQHTCNRILAASALLGDTLLVAFDTVEVVLHGCEALPAQRLLAVGANETLRMPRLFLVGEASRSDGLGGKGQRCVSEAVRRKRGDAGVGCRVGGLCRRVK